MIIKMIEVRDHATCIPVMAVLMEPANDIEYRFLRRAGYALNSNLVLFHPMSSNRASYDPYDSAWSGVRTIRIAHEYVTRNWNELESGSVVDVRGILGETRETATTEI